MAKTCEVVRLSKKVVEAAQPLRLPTGEVRQKLLLDSSLVGFGLCVGASARSYFAQRTVRGRSVRVTIGRHGVFTVEQARKEAQQMLARMAKGEDIAQTRRAERARGVTLRDAWKLAEGTLKVKGRSAKTISGYEYHLDTYLRDWLDRPLAEVSRADVRQRHLRIAEDIGKGRFAKGRARTEKHGRATANGAMRIFRLVFNRAMREHPELPSCPTINIDWFALQPRKAALPLSELHAWHAHVQQITNPIRRDFLLFVLATGLRRTSATEARWEHVDFERRVLRVPKPKGGEKRAFDLPLTEHLVALLQARKRENEEVFERSPWVFPAESESGHIEEPKQTFPGIPWTPHDLRRWFITVAEALDLSPYAIKLLVNHRLPGGDVTAGYVQHEVERLRPAMERIGERLRVLCTPPEQKVIALPRVGAQRGKQG